MRLGGGIAVTEHSLSLFQCWLSVPPSPTPDGPNYM